MKKTLKRFTRRAFRDQNIKFSLILISIIILISTIFLSLNVIGSTYKYSLGDIAREDIKSPREIQFVIKSETELNQRRIAEMIPLVFDKDQAVLYIKETDGAGGYEPGKIKTNDEKGLSKVEVGKLLETIAENDFWSLPRTGGEIGLDGAQWIIEGVSDGKYHVVERWSPDEGNVRGIGLYFLKMSSLNVNDDEIY